MHFTSFSVLKAYFNRFFFLMEICWVCLRNTVPLGLKQDYDLGGWRQSPLSTIIIATPDISGHVPNTWEVATCHLDMVRRDKQEHSHGTVVSPKKKKKIYIYMYIGLLIQYGHTIHKSPSYPFLQTVYISDWNKARSNNKMSTYKSRLQVMRDSS